MRKLLFYIFIFLSLSVKAETALSAEAGLALTFPKERKVAPNFSLTLLDGSSVSLSDLNGQIVLLNFWATFCHPCRKEMPALQILWKKYHNRGLSIIAVSIERGNQPDIEQYIKKTKLSFPIGMDISKRIQKNYEIKALPTTYIIGRDGKFIARAIGEREWANDTSFLYFENLLKNK